MTSYTGISPKNPSKYTGPNVYLSSIVTRNREPTGADYRQPETGKLYPTGSYWLISKDPTTGEEGDLWYLSRISANIAYWLQLSSGGSGTLIDIEVDAVTAPGVNPVTPILGQIDFHGAAVANHSVPVETHSRALHEMNVEVQYATTSASTDATKSGLAHFNSTQFSVDANGFVQLGGGGLAIDSIHPDSGTDPVVPTAAGLVNIVGSGSTTTVGSLNTLTIQLTGLTNHSVLVGAGTTTITKVAPAAAGTVLTSNGVSSDPSFQNLAVPGATNLGISYSAGTFTVRGSTASLSASNVAYVTIPSKTAGNMLTIPVIANQTFTDGSAGDIDNMRWGITTGINWANDMPFYLYAVINDAEDTIAFMISRIPHRTTAPAAAGIGKSGAIVNTGQGDMFSLLNITTTDYNGNPCICLGSFRMQFAGATDSYTVQTLANTDGIGMFNESTVFTYPAGQLGNATGSYFAANGGTAPIWLVQDAKYQLSKIGTVKYLFSNASAGPSPNGVGAVTLLSNLPFVYSAFSLSNTDIRWTNGAGTVLSLGQVGNPTPGSTTTNDFTIWNTTSDGYVLKNEDNAGSAHFGFATIEYNAQITT